MVSRLVSETVAEDAGTRYGRCRCSQGYISTRSQTFLVLILTAAGLGHYWLLKSQKYLSTIHREDASTSSATSSSRTSNGRPTNGFAFGLPFSYTQRDDDVAASRAASEAEARLHTPNYVEARALLVPATDLLSAAVNAADGQGTTTGDLLCLVSLLLFLRAHHSRTQTCSPVLTPSQRQQKLT